MSKMSQLHMELEESAADLGYENFEAALADGLKPNYATGRLEK